MNNKLYRIRYDNLNYNIIIIWNWFFYFENDCLSPTANNVECCNYVELSTAGILFIDFTDGIYYSVSTQLKINQKSIDIENLTK